MLTPTTSSSSSATGVTRSSGLDALLPSPGRELTASVRSVAASGTGAATFRVQVEVNSRLLELTTQAPLKQGDRILLQRGSSGELQIRMPSPASPQGQTPSSPSGVLLQLTSTDRQLQQLLPLNSPRTAQVISSEPATVPSATPGSATSPATRASAEPSGATRGPTQAATPSVPSAQPATGGRSAATQPSAPASATPATTAAGGQIYSAQLTSAAVTGQASPSSPTQPTSPATPAPSAASAATPSTAEATSAPPARPAPSAAPAEHSATPSLRETPAATTGSPRPAAQSSPSSSTAQPATSPGANATASTAATTQAGISFKVQALLQTLGQQAPATRSSSHLIGLSMNNQTFSLISPRPLLSGQQVLLTRVSEQQVSLQPLPATATSPVQDVASQQAVQQALREALPQQIPFADALNQMVQLSQGSAGRSQSAIGQLVQSMLSMFAVTPGGADAEQAIQRNLQQGGLFTESRLAQGKGERGVQADLKQQLGQLLKAAEKLPPDARQQMTRLVESLQARSTTRQISSLQSWKEQPDGTQERVYRLDLPIRQADQHDNAELTISEQRRRNPQGELETLWGVALHFDLEDYGSLDARLSLSEEWRLQIQFWAEEPHTLRQIERRLDSFSDDLHRKGFLVESLQARQGRPSQPELTDIQRRLVDIHT